MFHNFQWWIGVGVFFLSMLDNSLSALYTIKTVQRSPFWSGFLGGKIDLIGSLSIIAYTSEFGYVIPMYIGSFVGSYGAVYLSKWAGRRNRKNAQKRNRKHRKVEILENAT